MRHAEHHAKNRTSLCSLDQKTLFFDLPLINNNNNHNNNNNNSNNNNNNNGNDEENATAKTMSEMPENYMKLPKNDKTAVTQTTATAGQKFWKRQQTTQTDDKNG